MAPGDHAVSIRSPHRSKGRLELEQGGLEVGIVSIRSPHRSKGRRTDDVWLGFLRVVSIRSPHRSKGRQVQEGLFRVSQEFQSAPLTEARGDTFEGRRRAAFDMFQSAPLTEARETGGDREFGADHQVSIRSPHRSKGRLLPPPTQEILWTSFNPLPSPKQGETCLLRGQPRPILGFNPLPSPKQGETADDKGFPRQQLGFNPLPSPKQGETGRVVVSS